MNSSTTEINKILIAESSNGQIRKSYIQFLTAVRGIFINSMFLQDFIFLYKKEKWYRFHEWVDHRGLMHYGIYPFKDNVTYFEMISPEWINFVDYDYQ